MRFDILAAQYVYNSETNTRTGDTTYSFDIDPIIMQTRYDSAGTDTLDASNRTRANKINLTPGNFLQLGFTQDQAS